jgi:hypothetical protein
MAFGVVVGLLFAMGLGVSLFAKRMKKRQGFITCESEDPTLQTTSNRLFGSSS